MDGGGERWGSGLLSVKYDAVMVKLGKLGVGKFCTSTCTPSRTGVGVAMDPGQQEFVVSVLPRVKVGAWLGAWA